LVIREKGGFNNRLDSVTGRHGDLFDSFKLSIHSLNQGDVKTEAAGVPVGRGADMPTPAHTHRMAMSPDEPAPISDGFMG